MGKVEKWAVLGVVALIVGILVVSLTVDDPLDKHRVVMAGGSQEPESALMAEQSPAPSPSLGSPAGPLLNTTLVTPPQVAPLPETIPAGSILKTMEGLEPSYMSDARFYICQEGDTFPLLAQRFYGDPSRIAILKRLNEGRTELQPGDRVLIPTVDADAAPLASGAKAAAQPVKGGVAARSAPTAVATPTGARTHVVKEGESLWKIAKQELGAGARWNEIYEANRDVLSSPEALHTGQKLRIP